MPNLTVSPSIVPVSGTSPRELTILPPSVSPLCVKIASEAREPIGLSTLSSHVPLTSVTLAAAAGGGGGAVCWDGVVEQAAAIDATAATNTTRKVDIDWNPHEFERAQLNRCLRSVRAIAATFAN